MLFCFLRWHVSERILARMICFLGVTNLLTKSAPKYSPKFLSLYFVVRKVPKFASRQSFPPKNKKSPMSFCRSAGENYFNLFIYCGRLVEHFFSNTFVLANSLPFWASSAFKGSRTTCLVEHFCVQFGQKQAFESRKEGKGLCVCVFGGDERESEGCDPDCPVQTPFRLEKMPENGL